MPCRCCARGRSVEHDLKRFFADPRIRLGFSFQSKYLGMSPYRCPSLFTILAFMEYEFGIFPSARRHRLGDERDGRCRTRHGSADQPQRTGARTDVRGPQGHRAAYRCRRAAGGRRGAERGFPAQHGPAWCRTGCADAGPTARSPRRSSPARPSCCIWASRANCPRPRTTPSSCRRTTSRTSARSTKARRRRNRRRSTCRTPASPILRWRHPAIRRSTCWSRSATPARAAVIWNPAERARYRALALKRLEQAGLHDIEDQHRVREGPSPRTIGRASSTCIAAPSSTSRIRCRRC